MGEIKHVTDQDYNVEVEEAKGLVLVDFWAPWCGPCVMVGPILEELAEEMGNKVKICKVNIDESKQKAGELGIMSIPAIVLYKDGSIVETVVGARGKEGFVELINKHLK